MADGRALRPGPAVGVVSSYDDHRGDGWLRLGDVDVWFHCTQIADGSRHVEPGTQVTARLVPGLLGRLEAHEVLPR